MVAEALKIKIKTKIKSFPLIGTPPAQPSPPKGGEGEREPISMRFKHGDRLGIAGRCNFNKHRGQSPLPLGEG